MEKLSKKILAKYLSENFVFLKKTDSTFNETNHGIVIAARQSKGRGRLSRTFFSPKGGIYFSLLATPAPLLTIKTASGIMRAMEKRGLSPKVKWVNDIFIGGKKICGILAKESGGVVNIGVGVNYASKSLPKGINAGRLYKNAEGINEFTSLVISEIKKALSDQNGEDELNFYRERLLNKGGEITLFNGEKAVLIGVDDDGSLIYKADKEEKKLSYGDIYL